MSLRDRIRDAAIGAATGGQGEPVAARRATQTAAGVARIATDAGHPGLAAAAAVAAALVVVADDLIGHPCADAGYATFKDKT
ncbi:hypothetical protein [Streptomyces sp. H39-C1]|uniref:hypothetical protein n=1 Tax=Streptomyces sp. H39-C1 TaxID=3004355 RepID=UPI0022AEAF86|nr:hypothetical protein [Streptomyces sp. H39-C1]MCZ4099862.1 hypothetical protein [Streptomyces sp. H39-C1]